MNELRPDLTPLPEKMRGLPIDARGYPVPMFVDTMPDGTRDFRFMSRAHWLRCVKERACWVCGGSLGKFKAFVAGPMCGVNRTSSEPPSHRECAVWSAMNCPFLTKPKVVRREDELTREGVANVAGSPILRNPGCAMVWITEGYAVFPDGRGGYLITIGDPVEVLWFAEGRRAARTEVERSVKEGLPILMEMATEEGPAAVTDLMNARAAFDEWLPVE
jgi:hypothetical protein